MKSEPLQKFDQNKMIIANTTEPINEAVATKEKGSSPLSESTTDDSYNNTECNKKFWKLANTGYCLDKEENWEKLFSKIYINQASQNQARVKEIFTKYSHNGGILDAIKNLKCELCHDILSKDSSCCTQCHDSFCVDCLIKWEISHETICPNDCEAAKLENIQGEKLFLLNCIKFKCENFGKGCPSSFLKQMDLRSHQKKWEFGYTICKYCNKRKILKKDWGQHLLNSCQAISKWEYFPQWNFLGLKKEVEDHEDNNCGYTEIYWTTWKDKFIRKEKAVHSWISKLKLVLNTKENLFNESNNKLNKVTKDNEKLRELLQNMKKMLLEKCEYERKLKREVKSIQQEYPVITSHRRKHNKGKGIIKNNKRQKISEINEIWSIKNRNNRKEIGM